MNEEELVIDLPHVAAMAVATWIYLIAQNEEARDIISNLAEKIHNQMTIVEEDDDEAGTGGSAESNREGED